MAEKVSQGAPLRTSPLRKADFVNSLIDVVAAHNAGLLGRPSDSGKGIRIATDIVQVKNLTEADRERGQVVQLGEYLLDEIDSTALWFEGNTVDLPVTRRYAILLDPLPENDIGPAQMSGVCTAIVNVTDEDHTHAIPEAEEYVLKSCFNGPIELLSPPDGTGEQELAVRLNVYWGHLWGKPNATITKGSSGAVNVWSNASGSWSSTGKQVAATAIFAQLTSTKYCKLEYDVLSDLWLAGPAEC